MFKRLGFTTVLVLGLLVCVSSGAQAQQQRNGRVYISPQLRQQGRQLQRQFRVSRQDTIRQLESQRQKADRNVRVQRRWRDIPFNWGEGAARGGYLGALEQMIPDVYSAYRRQKQKSR